MTTQREADLINAERGRMAQRITEELLKLGVDVRVAHYTGDSSYPTEFTLSYQGITGSGPTFDMALMSWIGRLLEVSREPASAYQTMIFSLTSLAHGLSALRTDVLDMKAAVVKEDY